MLAEEFITGRVAARETAEREREIELVRTIGAEREARRELRRGPRRATRRTTPRGGSSAGAPVRELQSVGR